MWNQSSLFFLPVFFKGEIWWGQVLLELYDGLKSIVGVHGGEVGEIDSCKWRE